MKKIHFFFVFFITVFTACLDEQLIPKNTYKENFETLWRIVDTQYCYLDTKSINWDSVYTVYNTRLEKDTVNYLTFFDAMGDMLAELQDGHVNLYSSFDRSRYWKWFTDYPPNFNSEIIYSDKYLGEYRIASGLRYQLIENEKVGYIYYNSFMDSFNSTNIRYIFEYFKNCKGLIIDVRNNSGGSANLSNRLASYFFEKDSIGAYMQHKTGPDHSDFSELIPMIIKANKKILWKRPVVVLTNRASYSATNLFVCYMKTADQATIIGDRTGGGGGLPISNELPNGWMVRFSSTPMFDTNKEHIEFGIEPDIYVNLDTSDVKKGEDTLIEYAINYILTEENKFIDLHKNEEIKNN